MNSPYIINSDASVFRIGEHQWLTGAGVYAHDFSCSSQLGLATVNQAEFKGILLAAWLGVTKGRNTEIRTDSQFCASVVNGVYSSAKFSVYLEVFLLIKDLYRRLGLHTQVKWVPREENKEADKLARQATAKYKNELKTTKQ